MKSCSPRSPPKLNPSRVGHHAPICAVNRRNAASGARLTKIDFSTFTAVPSASAKRLNAASASSQPRLMRSR